MTISPEGLSAFRNCFPCLTHSSCTTPELNKPPLPRSPPGAGHLETSRLGLGRCSATRVPHSAPWPHPPNRPLGVKAWSTPSSPHPGQSLGGRRPPGSRANRGGGPSSRVSRGCPPAPAGKTHSPTAHDARGAQAQRPRGLTPRWVGSQRPGERPRRDAEAASGEFLLFHVVPQGLAQVLLRRLQLAHKGRHCSPRISPTSDLSATATGNRKNNSTKASSPATRSTPACPAPRSAEDLCLVFSSARLSAEKALSRARRFRGPPAPAPRVTSPACLARNRPAAARLQRRLPGWRLLGLSVLALLKYLIRSFYLDEYLLPPSLK